MKNYVIEFMKFKDIWYPTLCRYEVKADSFEDAVLKVAEDRTRTIEKQEILDAKEDALEDDDWLKVNDTENDLVLLAFNQILDWRDEDFRFLKGYVDGKVCADIIAKDYPASLNKLGTQQEEK